MSLQDTRKVFYKKSLCLYIPFLCVVSDPHLPSYQSPLSFLIIAGLLGMNSFSFLCLEISSSFFRSYLHWAKNSRLRIFCLFVFPTILKMLIHCFMACVVCDEKFASIFIFVHLYIICLF